MSTLPITEALLVAGGDERIALDPVSGLNKYGCPPRPDTALLAFASSTASAISVAGLAAAEALRVRLLAALDGTPATHVHARELARVRAELLALNGLDTLPGLGVLIAESGTDVHRIAALQTLTGHSQPGLAIMVESPETGSGVTTALENTSRANRRVEVCSVALRLPDGSPRSREAVDAEVETLATGAALQGRPVLLVLADQSRTGLIAPSPGCALNLARHHPDLITVLVDASQFRLAPATLRAYLQQDFMLCITGSKFLGGPAFSGALLVPAGVARKSGPLPWGTGRPVEDALNFGLLLRWEAALTSLRTFRTLPDVDIRQFMQRFSQAMAVRLAADPCLEALPAPALDRRSFQVAASWDQEQSIFSFILRHPDTGRPLSREQTLAVHRALPISTDGNSLRCQLGQPVPCGEREGVPVSALRLSLSADQISAALLPSGGTAVVLDQSRQALDKVGYLARRNG